MPVGSEEWQRRMDVTRENSRESKSHEAQLLAEAHTGARLWQTGAGQATTSGPSTRSLLPLTLFLSWSSSSHTEQTWIHASGLYGHTDLSVMLSPRLELFTMFHHAARQGTLTRTLGSSCYELDEHSVAKWDSMTSNGC